jgi:hypothetical protein
MRNWRNWGHGAIGNRSQYQNTAAASEGVSGLSVLSLARSFSTAVDWLKSPNATFSGQTPLSLLDTEIGAELVMDTLGRIEHGVFA